MTEKLSVILADDHGVLRAGLKGLINAQPDMHVVAEAGDGRSALELTRELRPAVLILDISMPELNGLLAMEQLQRERLPVRVLILTSHSEAAYVRQMLAAGVAGYVQKKSSAEDLIRALRVVAAGGTYLDPAMAGQVAAGFVEQKRLRGTREGAELSERETEVMRAVAEGYTNKEIAARLRISVKTVETHKSNSMGKLGLHSRAEVVRFAQHQGWL